jgi:hypothetical protein
LQREVPEVALPADLVARGYRLIGREPGRVFAVSEDAGCTGTHRTIEEVVSDARNIVGFIDWWKRKEQELRKQP